MLYKRLIIRLLVFGAILSSTFLKAAPDVKVGETLFKSQCASCHNKNMKDKLTGPPLAGAKAAWGDDKALYAWIRNSQASIASGHPRAVEIWNQYKPTVMTAFPNLKDDEIASILEYIDVAAKGPVAPPPPPPPGTSTDGSIGKSWIWLILGIVALLTIVLKYVLNNLEYLNKIRQGLPAEKVTLMQSLTGKTAVSFLVFALIVIGGFTTVNNAISFGRQQDYQPEQPIKFSHVTHAGVNKIDCQFCHDGARRSKQSVIPSANTCMNCHKAIKKGTKYGTEEITKIYASIGFDPNSDKYIENYENLSEKEVTDIYKKWIGSINEGASSGFVDNQWSNIKESLTSPHKPKIQGPIQWKRVHNLPDHAYFNHSQHVAVGKVACQKCHGQVEKMEVVKQVAPLSMGWCVNCHRETEVKFADNEYYKTYENYHKQLKEGKKAKVTVEDIGGLECQKCHY